MSGIIQSYFNNFGQHINENIETRNQYIIIAVTYILIILVTLIYYNYNSIAKHNTTLTSSFISTFVLIVIPIIGLVYYVFPKLSSDKINNSLLIFAVVLIGVSFYSNYLYPVLYKADYAVLKYMVYFIFAIMVIIGLAIFYYVFLNYLKTLTGWSGFLVYFIFYIPCLFLDFVRYIQNEFRMTSNIVFILFVIEALLLFLYFYIPTLLKSSLVTSGKPLLPDSRFLDISSVIATGEDLKVPKNASDLLTSAMQDTNYNFRQNFAISMWIYVNPQDTSHGAYNKETTIFDYGRGNPKITRLRNYTSKNIEDMYRFYFTNSTSTKSGQNSYYDLPLTGQKWNNIVFNYSNGTVDLFINGEIKRTMILDNFMPYTYDASDSIKVGEHNGLDGAICNVVYYNNPLSLYNIVVNYNYLQFKNPPIFD